MVTEARVLLKGHGDVTVWVAPQSDSWILRIGRLLFPAIRTAWVTLGEIVYHPDGDYRPLERTDILAHEHVHVRQWRRLGYVPFVFMYATAQGRWELEREAYLHEVLHLERSIDSCIAALGSKLYRLKVPRHEMFKWFTQAVARAAAKP